MMLNIPAYSTRRASPGRRCLALLLVLMMTASSVPAQVLAVTAGGDGIVASGSDSRGIVPSDENFEDVQYFPEDTDDNARNDTLTVAFLVSTTAVREPVSVLINVIDSTGRTVKTEWVNFTATAAGTQYQFYSFRAYYTGTYHMSLVLYDSDTVREDSDTSDEYFLDTGVVQHWITVTATSFDLDNDSFEDDVEVKVVNETEKAVSGAEVWMNGSLTGKTNASGALMTKDKRRAYYSIDAFYKGLHDSVVWFSQGNGTVTGWLMVNATMYDSDGDGLEDDAVISVRNALNAPVVGATVVINGTSYGATNAQGTRLAFDFERGWYIINVTRLTTRGSAWFWSEGQGEGTAVDEYFFGEDYAVLDVDGDQRWNDLLVEFDVDTDPPVNSTVTVEATVSWWGNFTEVATKRITYVTRGLASDVRNITFKDLMYGEYSVELTLRDSTNRTEDNGFLWVQVIRPSTHINVETGVHYVASDVQNQLMTDLLVTANRVERPVEGVTVTLVDSDGRQVASARTDEDGQVWFNDLDLSTYNWTAKDERGRVAERGAVLIGPRVNVETSLWDHDFDGFYDDFRVSAYTSAGRDVNTVRVNIWNPDGNQRVINATFGGAHTETDLPKGTYRFNATYLTRELCAGTFYSYGYESENFTVFPRPDAADLDKDGRYDDMNLTVVDNDDGVVEGARVYVDGVSKGTTDINGSLQVKDIAWGVHQVRAVYNKVVGTTYFFSEGGAARTATWTMLVLSQTDDSLDELEASGTSNATLMLNYAERTRVDPASHLWIVLPGTAQDVPLSRANSSMDAGDIYFLGNDGVLRSIVGYAFKRFPGTSTALILIGATTVENRLGLFLERELAATASANRQKWSLIAMQENTWTVESCYELRATFSYAVGVYSETDIPLQDVGALLRTTSATTARQLGDYIVGNVDSMSDEATSLADLSKMANLATQVNSLATALIGAYPAEGAHVQDARNASEFAWLAGDSFSYARRLADELARSLGTADLRNRAAAMRSAVEAATLKVSDPAFGLAIVFPNSTFVWNSGRMESYLENASLSKDTKWDEFLEVHRTFQEYGIEVSATAFIADGDNAENDVDVYVNDTYGKAVKGANVTIDLSYRNDTDATGHFKAYNFTRGAHLVQVDWQGHSAQAIFFSEGNLVSNKNPRVAILEPDEDDTVNVTVVVQGNASDPDGLVLYVEVRFDGGDWQQATGRNNWTYLWNTLLVDEGDYLIEARSYDGDVYSPIVGVNVTVYNPLQRTDILLVVDDGNQGAEVFYQEALAANGRAYDVLRVGMLEDGPDARRLKEADYVIWFTGEMDAHTLTATDLDSLVEYLDSGGRLFLTGQDVGSDITNNGRLTSPFMRDYLRANYITDNADDFDLVGVPNEDISEGVNVSIEGGSGARNQYFPDEIAPRSSGATVFLYNQTSEAGVKYGGAVFRTVYFGFGFEGISEARERARIMDNILDWLESGEPTVADRPPVVVAGGPYTTRVNEPLELRGSATDGDGVIALFEWDFDGDGDYDWANASTAVATHTYDHAGNFTAKLRATDNIGEFGTGTARVTVNPLPPNQRPVPQPGEEVEAFEGDPVEFIAAGYDPDGLVVLYEWDYEGDGRYDWTSTSPGLSTHNYATSGLFQATLGLTDNKGANATGVRTVVVRPIEDNEPPRANAGPDVSAVVGVEVTLLGTGTDPDGTIKLYKWDFTGDGVYDWTSDTTGTARTVYDRAGTFNARLLVIDNHDAAATDVARVTVTQPHENLPPVADAGGPTPLAAVVGVEASFNGTGEDPDGFIARYEWDFDDNGDYDWTSTQERTAYWTYTRSGLFIAMLRVTDNEGATDTDSRMVSVSSPEPPNVGPTADAGGPYDGLSGDAVRLRGTGSDPDGRIARYEWDYESDGQWDYESSSTGDATVIYDLSGTYTATLRVIDDDGASATDVATVEVTRSNAPPTVTVTRPTAGEKVKGNVVFEGKATDDKGVVKVEVQLDGGAWLSATGTTGWSFDFNAAGYRAGGHTLRVRAIDTNGETSEEVVVQFDVAKKEAQDTPGAGALAAAAAIAACAALGASMRSRRRVRA